MLFYFISIIVIYFIISTISRVLKSKPRQLVILYVSIWNRPYPSKKTIDKIIFWLVVFAYLTILISFIININN